MSHEALYPLRLRPIYKEKIWGGRNLARLLGKDLPGSAAIGESWEVADDAVVANGPLAGRRLADLTTTFGPALIGSLPTLRYGPVFPLLVKFIDAQDRLSVQVHPDDDQARRAEGVSFGKTEMWYVLDASAGAEIIHGIRSKRLSDGELARLAQEGGLVDHLHRVPVTAGDSIFIPAGTVHAMGEGLVIYEVQQNCDVTYRLYDWDRLTPEGLPRELHVARAAAVSRHGPREHKIPPLTLDESFGKRRMLAACRYFVVELLELRAALSLRAEGRSFVALSALRGGGAVVWDGGHVELNSGESAVIPAIIDRYDLVPAGDWQVIVSWVPDLARDVVQPLLAAGVGRKEILLLGGDLDSNDLAALLS